MMTAETERMREWAQPASVLFRALSNEIGLLVLCHLSQGAKSIEELAQLTGNKKTAITPQLSRLQRYNIVTSQRRNRRLFFSLTSREVPIFLDAAKRASEPIEL